MPHANTMTLQRNSDGIDWSALVDLFKLTNLGGREGNKIKEPSKRVTSCALPGMPPSSLGLLALSVTSNITPQSMTWRFILIIKGFLSVPG